MRKLDDMKTDYFPVSFWWFINDCHSLLSLSSGCTELSNFEAQWNVEWMRFLDDITKNGMEFGRVAFECKHQFIDKKSGTLYEGCCVFTAQCSTSSCYCTTDCVCVFLLRFIYLHMSVKIVTRSSATQSVAVCRCHDCMHALNVWPGHVLRCIRLCSIDKILYQKCVSPLFTVSLY